MTEAEILHSMRADIRIIWKRKRDGSETAVIPVPGKRGGGSSKNSRGTGDAADSGEQDSAKTWKQNRPVKLKFSYKEQREYDTIDEDIAKLEAKIEKLDQDIMANATNSGKLNELTKEKEETEALLEEKMDRWVYLNDLAEEIEAQNRK